MDIETRIDTLSKLLKFLTEFVKFCGLAALAAFAVTALAVPTWTQARLKALNLQVKEINLPGIKLVANGTFDIANTLVDTKMTLDVAAEQMATTGGKSEATTASVNEAIKNVEKMRVALQKQESAIRNQPGLSEVPLPESGWLTVGYVSESGAFFPSARIDGKKTVVTSGKLMQLQLKYDAHVMSTGFDCVKTDVADFRPPSPEALQQVQLLLRAEPYEPLKILDTSECPSAGKGKTLYAKIPVTKDRVRFAKFSELIQPL